MALVEKKCSYCGKFSWDSSSGLYNETHVNKSTGKTENCDTNGAVYVDGELQ